MKHGNIINSRLEPCNKDMLYKVAMSDNKKNRAPQC